MSSRISRPIERKQPEGSAYDRTKAPRRKRTGWKRVEKAVGALLTWAGCIVCPYIYKMMWWFICVTSKVKVDFGASFLQFEAEKRSMVSLLWHQNIFPVAYLFRKFRVTALAGTGTSGRIATALLEGCNFEVFRGGRKRAMVVRNMIDHLDSSPFVCYGIAVDGSKGPAKIMKPGGCVIARNTRSPIFLVHLGAKREFYTSTWDRMAITLPFNSFEAKVVGPYWIEPDCSAEIFETNRKHIENELLNLAHCVSMRLGKDRSAYEGANLPAGGRPFIQWPEGQEGQAFSKWDLQGDVIPPWARIPLKKEFNTA